MTRLKNGSCRPTIALRSDNGSPVTWASEVTGIPSEPKATGAVLPISASIAASNGRAPSPISMTAEMATGAPKPAAPSMKAPKLNAISSAWMRRSWERPAMDCRMISNWPVSTVTS
jgi:hypothetical protein